MRLLPARFVAFFLAPNLVFVGVALLVRAQTMIELFNAAQLALSIGVVVAYHKPVRDILWGKEPIDRGDWLALGIFLSWTGNLLLRLNSIIWRAMGRPDWFDNSQLANYALFMGMCAGAFHLAAPGAIGKGRVPTDRWVWIGILIASGVFAFLIAGYALDRFGLLTAPR